MKNVTRDHQGQAAGWPEGIGASPQGGNRPSYFAAEAQPRVFPILFGKSQLAFLIILFLVTCPVL